MSLVPAGDNEPGTVTASVSAFAPGAGGEIGGEGRSLPQAVLVGVADLLEDGSGRLCGRGLAVAHGKHAELVLYDIGHGLCVGGRAGTAAPDGIGNSGQLIRHSVGDVGAGRRSRVGTYTYGVIVSDSPGKGSAAQLQQWSVESMGKKEWWVTHLGSRRP